MVLDARITTMHSFACIARRRSLIQHRAPQRLSAPKNDWDIGIFLKIFDLCIQGNFTRFFRRQHLPKWFGCHISHLFRGRDAIFPVYVSYKRSGFEQISRKQILGKDLEYFRSYTTEYTVQRTNLRISAMSRRSQRIWTIKCMFYADRMWQDKTCLYRSSWFWFWEIISVHFQSFPMFARKRSILDVWKVVQLYNS